VVEIDTPTLPVCPAPTPLRNARMWVREPDALARRRIALELGHLAMIEAGTIPLGKFVERTAFRRTITGIIPGPCPYPWNVRPA
jgi:peptide/nickel transport system substrate-binding protein